MAAGLTAGASVALSGTASAAGCNGLTGLRGRLCTTSGSVTIAAGGLA